MSANAERDGRSAKRRCMAPSVLRRKVWLTKLSQPLVGRSLPYYEDMCDGAQMAIFGDFFESCICSEPRAVHF